MDSDRRFVATCFEVRQIRIDCSILDRKKMLASLVGRAAWVRPLVRDGLLVDPVQELADVTAPQLLDGDAATPPLSLPEGGEILVACRARQGLGAQVALRWGLEGRRHLIGPCAAAPRPAARPARGAHPRICLSNFQLLNRTECAPGTHGIRPRRNARLRPLPIAASRTPARVPDRGLPDRIARGHCLRSQASWSLFARGSHQELPPMITSEARRLS
jgi:hypothetical protein